MKHAVAISICEALLMDLCGYRHYPSTVEGRMVFAKALQRVSLSVDHARAIVDSFDMEFPTVREIIETGNRLSDKFTVAVDLVKQWETEYGPRRPFDASELYKTDPTGAYWAADAEMWRRIKMEVGKDFAKCSWPEVYRAKKKLGYELNRYEQKILAGTLL
jgi:hypothetical protein